MQKTFLTKTNIAILLAVFFILAPLLAWVTTPHYTEQTGRTANDFYKAITAYNTDAGTDQKIPDVTIKSSKRYDDVWYIVDVTSKKDDLDGKMLIADFFHDPNRVQVVSPPFTTAFQGNISDIGVPYRVLDILNNNQEDSTDE